MILTIIIYLFIENSLVFNECLSFYLKGHLGSDLMVVGCNITTDVVSLNPAQARCTRYHIM